MATYSETLRYLYAYLPSYQREGKSALKKGMKNISALCEALDNPHKKYPLIHIAGTNGKGSVTHTLGAIFSHAGYKVGTYTSPHICDFSERIQMNATPISHQMVIDYTHRMKPLIETLRPSFFEITVAMAFIYFAKQQVDIACIETGLGGTWDSTNIVSPILSVITTISADHQDVLGQSLQSIAQEKAGIIKKEIPVVLGDIASELRPIFERQAQQQHAPLSYSDAYQTQTIQESLDTRKVSVLKSGALCYKHISLGIASDYYLQNLPVILSSADSLRQNGFAYREEDLRKGLRSVARRLVGRWQFLGEKPYVLCDIAHNEAALRAVFSQIDRQFRGHIYVILALSKEKALSEILDVLPLSATYFATEAQLPRALPSILLYEAMKEKHLHVTHTPGLEDAYQYARAAARPQDLVLICGSAYLVANYLDLFKQKLLYAQ